MNHLEFYYLFSKSILKQDEIKDISCLKKDSRKNLKVYQHNYLFGLIKVLENNYSVVFQFLGENNFNYFSRQFILEYPSLSPNMNEYGKEFANFLNEQTQLDEFSFLPYLAQVDCLWAYQDFSGVSIEVPKGILNLWGKIKNGEALDQIVVSEEVHEKIFLKQEKGECFLVSEEID